MLVSASHWLTLTYPVAYGVPFSLACGQLSRFVNIWRAKHHLWVLTTSFNLLATVYRGLHASHSLRWELRSGPSRRGKRGESFPEPRDVWGPAVAQKYCSIWLLSDLKYAQNPFSAEGPPRTPLGELTTLSQIPSRRSRMVRGNPSPRFLPSTPSASRSGRIRNEVVIGPRDRP